MLGLRIRGPRVEAAFLVVLDFHGLARHDLVEDEVDRRKDFSAAAEVLLHRDELFHVIGSRLLGIGIVLLLEQVRVSEAEAVDALLDVADGEAVVIARDEVQDGLLDTVRILVLVDHDDSILLAQVLRRIRAQRPALLTAEICFFHSSKCRRIAAEHGEREMLEVVEVEDIALFLGRLQCIDESGRQVCIAPHRRAARSDVPQYILLSLRHVAIPGIREDLLGLVAVLLERLADLRERRAQRIVFLAAQHGLLPLPGRSAEIVPAARLLLGQGRAVGGLHLFQLLDAPLQVFGIGLPGREQGRLLFLGTAACPDERTRLFVGADAAFDLAAHSRDNRIRPRRLPEVRRLRFIALLLLAQPRLREGLALAEAVELQHGIVDSLIAVVVAIVVDELEKILPPGLPILILWHLVGGLEQFLQDIAAHQDHLLVAGQTKLRVHIDGVDVLADDLLAEGVERADRGAGQQDNLALEPFGCRAVIRL